MTNQKKFLNFADSFIGIEGFKEGPPPHTAQGHKKRGQKMKEGREGPGNKGAGRRLMKMKRFLNFVSELHTSVSDPTGAAGFAALGIKDYHKRTGQVQNAVPEIEEALKATKKQETRNVLLFTLRQIHEESKDHAAVYEINKRLLKENAQ